MAEIQTKENVLNSKNVYKNCLQYGF